MSLHEECGVFGIISPKKTNLAAITYYGLYALQHRGQEAAGIAVSADGDFFLIKDVGLVGEVFTKEKLATFPEATVAVGHVRYGTTGGATVNNCQPIDVKNRREKLAIAHNGNLSNAYKLRNELELSGAIFHTTSDTETIAYIVTRERLSTDTVEEAILRAMEKLEGAYSLVIMTADKLIAVRDPHGLRPLCFGKRADGSYVVASESAALTSVGAEFIRDLRAGEMIVFDGSSLKEYDRHVGVRARRTCIFEHIYFARPDSVIDGVSVQESRIKAGAILARKFPVDADVVIGVPDSGLDAALGYARESGIPYGIGLIKNKYIGRTFISPGQSDRLDKVRIKLSPVRGAIEGKRVVLIDDSIVRGTTSGRLVKLLRDAGATEIHMRVSAPPFLHPCYYGTDIDSEQHLIACKHTVSEIAEIIGVDSLGYLPIESLPELVGGRDYCSACFDGSYPTEIPENPSKNCFEK